MAEVDWSELPEELLQMIADRLFSGVELICFRSICRSWRSSVAGDKPFPCRPLIHLSPLVPHRNPFSRLGLGEETHRGAFLSRATYFRVTLPSASVRQGWLIKFEELESGKRRLICPLSRLPINHSCESLDLFKFGVSEIQEGYDIKCLQKKITFSGIKRVVMVMVGDETRVIGIGCDGKLRHWSENIWTKIEDQVDTFWDIIVHRGQIYVVDINGIVWWVDSSLSLMQYAPPLNSHGGDKSFVESRGELYIVDRLIKGKTRKGQAIDHAFARRIGVHCFHTFIRDKDGVMPCNIVTENDSDTVGFKVYKLDEEWGRWMEVKSLGDRAFIVATDCCFSISASEFYGCLESSIYFTDEDDSEKPGSGLNGHDLRVFKLDDGSIMNKKSCYNYFQMFSPCFLET